MYKQYFKLALQSIRENPLVSSISIAGTALSIAMIMVVVLIFQIRSANYAPETNRDRMLYVHGTEVKSNAREGSRSRGKMSQEVVRECFYSLETPEAVTAIASENKPVSLPGKRLFNRYRIKYTDSGFWSVFEFRFIKGKPFGQDDFSSGICGAVVSEKLAKEVFGSTDVVGMTCILDFSEYTIRGVVKDVTVAATDAYAEMWVPYTSKSSYFIVNNTFENMRGDFSVLILAKKRSDFKLIEDELHKRTALYNTGKKDFTVGFIDNPIRKTDIAMGSDEHHKVPVKEYLLNTGALLLFLLLIPTFNLTGVIQSSIQKRQEEIGIRKVFGATSGRILSQIIWENFIITFIGALIGVLLSFLFLWLCKSFLLTEQTQLTFGMLFKPWLFVAALLFTFLLNVLCSGIPALQISRKKIVDILRND
jgi:ABC-type antimicrobial peptide transport system, permease component